jgi:hypothetical protein
MAIRTPPAWNDDDERLLNLVAENGRKWKLISRRFEDDDTELECKSKWLFLLNQRPLRESGIVGKGNSDTLVCF